MKRKNDPRHQSRRLALQSLFELVFRDKETLNERLNYFLSTEDIPITEQSIFLPKSFNRDLLQLIVKGVVEKQNELDKIIADCAPEWPLDQIARVDLSVLRIAVYELLYYPDTPNKVAIDEAVELAKEFGGLSSSKFVNGVLGTVVKNYLDTSEKEITTENPNTELSNKG